MSATVTVRHRDHQVSAGRSTTHPGQGFVQVRNLEFDDIPALHAHLHPHEMRQIGQALISAAAEIERDHDPA